MKRHHRIRTFYTPKQVLQTDDEENYSKSPLKPKLLLEYIEKQNLSGYFEITSSFEGFKDEDFLIAHHERYVKSFFKGLQPLCESNGLKWSEQFADSVRYTNASLYHAIKHSINNPDEVCLAPVSGMHHATYDRGGSYCSMSGQVIASVKIYRELGLSGAYVDLDAHFGNSIEDSRFFVTDLSEAIPIGCNINPDGKHQSYIADLKSRLKTLEKKILDDEIHYVVFAHGADSHEWDDLGVQCTTAEWLECSDIVYEFVDAVSLKINRPLPLTLALFGGYRNDDYNSVLSLHTGDLVACLNKLSKENIRFEPEVKNRRS